MRSETKRALAEMDISVPTEVQNMVLPNMLEGKDCLVQSPTGTGKTFAFGVPILEKIYVENKNIQAVIVCPTRELAEQSAKAIKNLSKYIESLKIACIVGGQHFERQLNALKRKPQIVVGTPGRMVDMIERKALRIKKSNLLVLDEADEMLKMGFRDELNKIIEQMPTDAQKTFFSATIPNEIAVMSKSFQNNPVNLKVTLEGSELPQIKQYVIKLNGKKKFSALKNIIETNNYNSVLVFCNTKAMVDNVKDKLVKEGYKALGLHGDMIQRHRTRVMNSFRNKEINILVASDVAARGIDVENIEAIFNYDIPIQVEYYIHRIGRTARANRTGVAYSFLSSRDVGLIREIEREVGIKMEELVIDNITDTNLSLKTNNGATTRLFMNVGTKDNLTNKKLFELLKSKCNVEEDQIREIKLLEMFSFVEVNKEVAEIIKNISGMTFCRRKLNIENAEKSGTKESNKKRGGSNFSKDKKPYGERNKSNNRKNSISDKKLSEKKNYSDDRKISGKKDWSDDRKPSVKKDWSDDRKSSGKKDWSDDRKKSSAKNISEKREWSKGNKPNRETNERKSANKNYSKDRNNSNYKAKGNTKNYKKAVK